MKLIKFEPVPEWFTYPTDIIGIYNNQSILPYKFGTGIYISIHDSPILYQRVYDHNHNHKHWFKRLLDFINPFR